MIYNYHGKMSKIGKMNIVPHHILHFKNQERKRMKELFQKNIYENTKERKIFNYIYLIEFKENPLYQWLIETLNSV